ncbi:MAG: CidA/LrgA family protein [Pseudomonadota bacterium]
MQALRGLAWLLAFQSLGELLARGLKLPFPGPVIGMILLLFALRWRRVREPVNVCADFILVHLSLLFVPVGVGVMTHLSLVSQYGFRMLAVIVLSTIAGLAVTVLSLHWLRAPTEDALQEDGDAPLC